MAAKTTDQQPPKHLDPSLSFAPTLDEVLGEASTGDETAAARTTSAASTVAEATARAKAAAMDRRTEKRKAQREAATVLGTTYAGLLSDDNGEAESADNNGGVNSDSAEHGGESQDNCNSPLKPVPANSAPRVVNLDEDDDDAGDTTLVTRSRSSAVAEGEEERREVIEPLEDDEEGEAGDGGDGDDFDVPLERADSPDAFPDVSSVESESIETMRSTPLLDGESQRSRAEEAASALQPTIARIRDSLKTFTAAIQDRRSSIDDISVAPIAAATRAAQKATATKPMVDFRTFLDLEEPRDDGASHNVGSFGSETSASEFTRSQSPMGGKEPVHISSARSTPTSHALSNPRSPVSSAGLDVDIGSGGRVSRSPGRALGQRHDHLAAAARDAERGLQEVTALVQVMATECASYRSHLKRSTDRAVALTEKLESLQQQLDQSIVKHQNSAGRVEVLLHTLARERSMASQSADAAQLANKPTVPSIVLMQTQNLFLNAQRAANQARDEADEMQAAHGLLKDEMELAKARAELSESRLASLVRHCQANGLHVPPELSGNHGGGDSSRRFEDPKEDLEL